MEWKSMKDRRNGQKAKNRTINYKEQRPQAWCGNDVLSDYWKKKDEEHRLKKAGVI